MEYGYARVSTTDQILDRQVEALIEAGIPERNIITDKESGKGFDRRGYNSLVGTETTAPLLRQGDLLTIYSIDRLGRNYEGIRREWQKITCDLGCDIRVLDMPLLDTRSSGDQNLDRRFISDLVLQILSYVAEKERLSNLARQRAAYDALEKDEKGRMISKRTGIHLGRHEVEFPDGWEEIYLQWENNEITAVQAMKMLGLKKTTFYKLIKENGLSRNPGSNKGENDA